MVLNYEPLLDHLHLLQRERESTEFLVNLGRKRLKADIGSSLDLFTCAFSLKLYFKYIHCFSESQRPQKGLTDCLSEYKHRHFPTDRSIQFK